MAIRDREPCAGAHYHTAGRLGSVRQVGLVP